MKPLGHLPCSLLTLALALLYLKAGAQVNIPVGAWRMHLSFNDIRHVQLSERSVFASTESGILIFDRTDRTLSTINKLGGLSSSGISALRYDTDTDQLLVGYEAGELDIITSDEILNFNRLRDAEIITSRRINHISSYNRLAYLATTYGVVVFDLSRREIRETWRDLGDVGERLAVHQSTFQNDSVYLATAAGIIAGRITDNLLDYNSWDRFPLGNVPGEALAITTFNDKVYAAGEKGLFRLGAGKWIQEPFLDTVRIRSLSAGQHLYMIADSTIWMLNVTGQLSKLSPAVLNSPAAVQQDENGTLWIGDRRAGLISNVSGSFGTFVPNGPSRARVSRMTYHQGKLYTVSGGFFAGQPLHIPAEVNVFGNGSWTTMEYPAKDLTDIAFDETQMFLASFGSGVLVVDQANHTTILNEDNSPLGNAAAGSIYVTALATSAQGLWIANYGAAQPVHLLRRDGTWESFSINLPNATTPTTLAVDAMGNLWIALDPATGGGLVVLNPNTGEASSKSAAQGGGNLPSSNVLSLALDRGGLMWVGTDPGIAYFFSPKEDGQKPIYEGRFLLRDQRITAIEIDGGNRTWIGTNEGAWLFADAGQELVQHFNSENSPLLSDVILDIETDDVTGEVFFATERGIVSYRGDATVPSEKSKTVKIFPNPVYPGYAGTIGISGLPEDAWVKITDVSGRLVWQTQANGGMATWNARDSRGNRVATGVYLVFSVSKDGRESTVGKVAVVE